MNSLEALEEIEPKLCDGCYRKRDAMAVLRADAQALADVRTLDETATEGSMWATRVVDGVCWCDRRVWRDEANAWLSAEGFEGSTPDEARAKAAAWVRERQAR